MARGGQTSSLMKVQIGISSPSFGMFAGEKLDLKTALPLVPCSLGNQASFAWQARQGFAVADMKLDTTTWSISSLTNRKGQ